MATTTDVHRRVQLNLETIGLMLGELPEVAAEWDDISIDERISWSLAWSNEMAGLELLAGYRAEGLLTGDQQARLHELLRQLKAALPVIDRLGLQAPSMGIVRLQPSSGPKTNRSPS